MNINSLLNQQYLRNKEETGMVEVVAEANNVDMKVWTE